MASRQEILKAVERKLEKGLYSVGNEVVRQSLRFTPISRGKLRNSLKVVRTGPLKVTVQAGEGIPYARAQYFNPPAGQSRTSSRQGGHIVRGGEFARMLDGFSDRSSRPTLSPAFANRYQRAYRARREAGELRGLPGFGGAPRWFERTLESSGFKAQARQVFINAIIKG